MAPLLGRKLEPSRGVAARAPCRREPAAAAAAKARGGCYALLWPALATGVAAAQPAVVAPPDIAVSSTLERIVASAAADAQHVELAAGTVASHADQLILSVRFANVSGAVVDTVRITSAIPADVRYVPGSASGPGSAVLFSVDNGRTFGRPAELTLPAAGGGTRPADAADYTHVRFILDAPLDAGATGVARFRAVPR